jgi:hypothetical protein
LKPVRSSNRKAKNASFLWAWASIISKVLLIQEIGLVYGADGLALERAGGEETVSSRLVFGVSSLPLGSPVELEVILEVKP